MPKPQLPNVNFVRGLFALIAVVAIAPQSLMAAGALDTWHPRAAPLANASLSAIAFGNGRFVAFADSENRVITSTNGADWEMHPAPYPSFKTLAFGNGVFLAAFGSYQSQPQRIYTSADGVAWLLRFTAPADNVTDIRAIEFGGGKFVAVGTSIWSSSDLTNWAAWAYGTVSFSDVAFGKSVFAAVDGSGIWTSADSTSWTYRGSSFGSTRVAFGNGRFVAVGYPSGRSLVSLDGFTWVLNSTTNVPPPYTTGPLAFAGGYFLSLSATSGSNFLASTNGVDWISHDFGTNWAPGAIAFGNNTLVAVGGSSMILQSDPFTGSSAPSPPSLSMIVPAWLKISGEVGRDYEIEYVDSLGSSNGFQVLATVHLTNSPCWWFDSSATNVGRRFYRVGAVVP